MTDKNAQDQELPSLPKILLAVTGCAQAEVTPRLVHNLKHHPDIGTHEVMVVATKPALQFFEKEIIEKLTGKPVFTDHSEGNEEFPVPHINLAQWADLILVYPASANTVAKCAHGFTESLVANIVLASDCPVYLGPTMNKLMYEKPATQRNLNLLEENGYHLIPQQLAKIVVRATGMMEEKMFCTEVMVLNVVDEVLHGTAIEEDRASFGKAEVSTKQ